MINVSGLEFMIIYGVGRPLIMCLFGYVGNGGLGSRPCILTYLVLETL
jgi:hypothetical protein